MKALNQRLIALVASLVSVQFSNLSPVYADEQENPLLHRSLDELIEMEVEVTSKSNRSIREAPGVVTVVTREQIENSGAWDLLEVLRLVPGVQFGVDVQGSVGIGIRGLWGHEGKVLLLWNGHEMNEQIYATTQLSGRFPIEEIERVEMIRGPGSVLYGGFAELAVINVVTRDAKSLDGGVISLGAGHTDSALSHRQSGFALGKEIGDLRIKTSVFAGESLQSDGSYRDVYGTSYSLEEDSNQQPQMFSLDGGYGNFDLRLLADRYQVRQRDEYAEALSEEVTTSFDSYHALLLYHAKPLDALLINAKLGYKVEYPWKEDALPTGDNSSYDKSVEHYSGQVSAQYQYDEIWSGLLGVDYSWDHARDYQDETFSNDKQSITFWDYAPFVEGEARTSWANVRAGVRVDRHEQFGSNTVPRLSITKEYERSHFKLLASKAYRAPAIANIDRNAAARAQGYEIEEIQPEETTVYEFEAGYKVSDNFHATLNLFHTTIDDPIVYFVDDASNLEGYANAKRAGTQGIELATQWIEDWGYLNMSYSYYERISGDATTYEVPNHSSDFLGFSRHKVTANSHIEMSDRFALNSSLIVYGGRFGYESVDLNGSPQLSQFDPAFLLNTSVSYRVPQADGVKISVGIANILDEDYAYIQPYNNLHAPLGTLGREYWLKLVYAF